MERRKAANDGLPALCQSVLWCEESKEKPADKNNCATQRRPTSKYRHNRTNEDNADAHLKRQIMGREVVVAITNGKLDFGPWEQICYGEFDGSRRKRALVKIIGM